MPFDLDLQGGSRAEQLVPIGVSSYSGMGLTAMGWVGGRAWSGGRGGWGDLGDLGDSRAAAHTFVWGLYLNRKHSTRGLWRQWGQTRAVRTHGPVTKPAKFAALLALQRVGPGGASS